MYGVCVTKNLIKRIEGGTPLLHTMQSLHTFVVTLIILDSTRQSVAIERGKIIYFGSKTFVSIIMILVEFSLSGLGEDSRPF